MPSARFLSATLLAAVLLVTAACASQPTPLAANDNASADRSSCIPTGSRIRTRDGDCSPKGYPFRSYSAEELQDTGEIGLLEALRQIDPAFQ